MLVVIVVSDGHGDGAGVRGSLHGSEGNAAAHGWQQDDRLVGAFDGGDDFLGDGQIHRSADGVVTGQVAHEHGDTGVRGEDFLRGFVIHDEVAAGANVVDDALLLVVPVDADDEAEVKVGGGGGRDDVGGVGSGGA